MMDIGFNIIERSDPKLFGEKLSIIEFLRRIDEEEFPLNFAVTGLDALLYYAEDRDKISRYIRDVLQDHANLLTKGNYIIQIAIEGTLHIVESFERPRIKHREEEFLLYPIFGRVKQVDAKHFLAPLNLLS